MQKCKSRNILGWVITITTLTNLWKNGYQLPFLYLVHIKPLYQVAINLVLTYLLFLKLLQQKATLEVMSISIKFVFYVHYFRQMAIFHVTLVQIYPLTKHFKCFVLKGGLTKSYVISCPVENITFLKLISSSAQFIVSAKRSKIFKIGKCPLVQAFKIPQNQVSIRHADLKILPQTFGQKIKFNFLPFAFCLLPFSKFISTQFNLAQLYSV